VGTILKSLNAKVDALARIMTLDQNPLQPAQWQPINLSEGGVAFASSDERLEEGALIAIRLTLPPEFFRPWGIVEVISRSPKTDGEHWIHTEFRHLQDADRRQIARHVMQWQIRQRNQRLSANGEA
jgi:c-di-GMP-binding flagellar brake protein YcgR